MSDYTPKLERVKRIDEDEEEKKKTQLGQTLDGKLGYYQQGIVQTTDGQSYQGYKN